MNNWNSEFQIVILRVAFPQSNPWNVGITPGFESLRVERHPHIHPRTPRVHSTHLVEPVAKRMQNSIPEENPLYIDQVYLRLLESISLGELKPGERVRQSALAERLGVSRQPISHALQLLKHQGLVRDAGKQGVEVTPVDPDRVLHLYAARTPLEASAASLAAARVRSGAASPDDVAALTGALARGGQAARESASLTALARADSDFHAALYRLSGNPVIEQMMAGQWPHLMRSMLAVLGDRGTPARAWEEHAQITAFVLAGDAAAAADVVTRHLVRAGHDLHRRLGGHGVSAGDRRL